MNYIEGIICRETLLKATGKTLKRIRKKYSGLRQSDLSEKSNVSKNAISLIETGQIAPTIDTIFRLCAVLEIDEVEFIAAIQKEYRALNKDAYIKKQALATYTNLL